MLDSIGLRWPAVPVRRIAVALAVLMSGCLTVAPASAQGTVITAVPTISCPSTAPGTVLCAVGAVLKIIPDTVPVNHYCVLKTTWDCSALSAPVVSAPVPVIPILGHAFHQVSIDQPVSVDSFGLTKAQTLANKWVASTATPWVTLLNSYNGYVGGYDSGILRWQIDLSSKPLGFYVDTIAIALTDGTHPIVIDTEHVVPAGTAPIVPPAPPPSSSSSGGSSPASPPPAPPPPPPFLTSALPAHPRVWMTPARLVQLKAQAAANTSRWQVVKQYADASVARGAVYTGADEFALPALCAVYLGTGNQAYATRAGVVIAGGAVEDDNLQGDSGYAYRFNLPDFIMGLDWCYAGLTVTQRHQAATWLMNRADWVWPETNPSRANGWGLWPSNNYYWGFMMSGPAAIAAAGDDTITTTAVSGPDRPAYHRALAMQHWNLVAVPYLAGEGAGGAWDEGTNYGSGSQWYLGRFADAYATSGTPIASSWLGDALRWGFASMMPGGRFKAPFGDQARESDAAEYAYDRVAALDVLAAISDPTLAAQVQTFLGLIGNVPSSDAGTAVATDELIHFNPAAPAATDLSAQPKCFLAAGPGYAVCRTSWTDPNALAFTFQAGAVGDGHNSLQANGLMIWGGGDWITASANLYSASGIEQASRHYNTLTIGDSGQVFFGGNDGAITEKQFTDTLMVLRGEAGNAYGHPWGVGNGRNIAIGYARTVAFLPALSAFVVVDQATAVTPSMQKVWRWQMHHQPTIAGNTFTLSNDGGTGKCLGTIALGSPALAIAPDSIGPGFTQSSYAVTVSPPAGRATDLLVTVLQCRAGAPATVTAADGPAATTVTIGSTHLTIPHADSAKVTMP
ncbi:MAG TPA: hypothetical protein VGM20_04310 [Gemmatimonadales bacterium]|jgi:hypothetical protein